VALLCFCVASCGPPANPQALREEVVKIDSRFAEVLEKRDELANRIKVLERELALKKSQVGHQIAQLRKELNEATQQFNQKIQKTKTLLAPDVERIELALSMAADELKGRRHMRASLGCSISRLRKALKSEQAQWAQSERARMDQELAELLQETQRLDQEIAVLNEHIRLLKIKRLLLRL